MSDAGWQPPPLGRVARVLVVGALVAGIAARVAAVARLGPHVDEAASVMAAIQTAAEGVPRLPSGILYTQGLTQSYLLAPLAAMGWLGAGLLLPRALSLVAGVATLLVALQLGRRTLNRPVGLAFFTWFIALDPGLVQWSAHVRPYALLALAGAVSLLGFVDVLERGLRRGNVAAWVGGFTFGMFTHVTTALLWPGMALAMAFSLGFGRETRTRWGVLFGLLLAPLTLQLGNLAFSVSSRGNAGTLPVKFVGDHLIDLNRINLPVINGWRLMYEGSALADVMPVFVAGAVGYALARGHRGLSALLPVYVVPMVALSVFVTEQQGRYVLNVAILGWWVVAAAVELAWEGSRTSRALGAILGGLGLFSVAHGAVQRWLTTDVDPNYQRAVAYVLEHTKPGERPVVFSALTPVVWVAARDGVDLRFLAGPENGIRAKRYVLPRPTGPVDWWAGVSAVGSTRALCAQLAAAPQAYLIYDGERMSLPNYGFAGGYANVIRGASSVVWQRPGTAIVARVKPTHEWTHEAARLCNLNVTAPPPSSGGGWTTSEG